MRKIRAILGALGVVSILSSVSLLASSTPSHENVRVFNPRHFERTTDNPFVTRSTFTAPSAGSDYTIRVHNGGDDGQFHHVTSAFVFLNGKQILGPSDFDDKHSIIERVVHLEKENEIRVEIRSGKHTGCTIEISKKDSTPPTVSGLAEPLPNTQGWNNTNVIVRFACADAGSGVASCSGPVTVSNEGGNQQIAGTAKDNAGNLAHATVVVSLDKTKPVIMATPSPAPNTNGWNNGNVTVTFACSDALSGIASCTLPINLTNEGAAQTASGAAMDLAGNSATASALVSIDKTAPAVSISPALPATASNSLLNVTGTVSDGLSGIAAVTCNGVAATVSGSAFSCAVSLAPGANTINVTALDLAGNSQLATADVMFQTFVPPPPGPVAVSWVNAVGVSVNANNLTKTDGSSTWNAGASSREVIRDGYGFVEFQATEANTSRIIGLDTKDSSQSFNDVDFGILLRGDTSVAIFEGGFSYGDYGSYAPGDTFRVEVRYGVVSYKRNGVGFYTSTSPAHYPLHVDVSLRTPGATVTNVRVGNFVWTDAVMASISGTSLTKSGAAGWNAGAVSTNTIETGDGYMEFSAAETNTTRLAGLANLNTGPSIGDIQFGVQLNNNGTVEVMEGGTSRGVVGGYAGGDRFRIEIVGGIVRYYRNTTQLYTSLQTPTYPLHAEATLDTPGATLTDFILEPIAWKNTLGVFTDSATLVKTSVDGWTGFTSSTSEIQSGDGYVEFTALETDKRRALGLKRPGASQSLQDIDWAILLNETGNIEIVENGNNLGQFGSYQNGERFRIEIQNGIVRYYGNDVVLLSSSVPPAYPLHAEAALYSEAATLFDVAMGDVVWMNKVSVQASGRTLVKTSPSAVWDAGAVSTRTISSGYMEFTASETASDRIAGLSNGDSGQDYTDIDYAVLLRSDGTVAIFEAGFDRGEFGSYVSGDKFRVEIQGGVVRYRKNGDLFYTSSVAPVLPLRIDTGFAGPNGGTLFNVVLN